MSTSIRIRYFVDIGGQPYPFANPFTIQSLEVDPDPLVYQVAIPVASTGTLWLNTYPLTTLDMLVIQSDVAVDIECVVGSDAQHFTLPVRAGGWPTIVPGGQCYAGQTGAQSAFTSGTLQEITRINAHNSDTLNIANVSVLIAKAA